MLRFALLRFNLAGWDKTREYLRLKLFIQIFAYFIFLLKRRKDIFETHVLGHLMEQLSTTG